MKDLIKGPVETCPSSHTHTNPARVLHRSRFKVEAKYSQLTSRPGERRRKMRKRKKKKKKKKKKKRRRRE
jgi:hypothetical protein